MATVRPGRAFLEKLRIVSKKIVALLWPREENQKNSLSPERRQGMVEVRVNLPRETVNGLKELAAQQGITQTTLVIHAIKNQQFLLGEKDKGSKVWIVRNDGSKREVVFH